MTTAASDTRTTTAVYVVEATSAERNHLWMEWSEEALSKGWGTPRNRRVSWVSDPWAHQTVVGTLARHDVRIDISYATIYGCPVLFWHHDSRVVDFALCERWLQAHVAAFDDRHANADNFHHVIAYLEPKP